MRSMLSVISAMIISMSCAHALESRVTVRSSLSPDELWKEVGDFCGLPAWDPAIERCMLGADGKRRTVVFFGGVLRVEAELEDRDDAARSYGWRIVSETPAIANYRARVRVSTDGGASALTWTANYEAKGIPDAEAQSLMDASIYRVLCMGGPLLCNDDQSVIKPPEEVSFESLAASSPPLILRGYLRRPDGAGPFPAVVLLHGCNGAPKVLDRNWGPRIAGWGYVTLTVDAFGPRGRKNACTGGPPQDMGYDAYSALRFLVRQSFVDPKRVFVVGFSLGGLESLNAVERGPIEQGAANKFLAAAAFYPVCTGVNGPMTVSTLILTGEADDWTVADACRKLVAGQDDLGVSRRGAADGPPIQLIIYPGAFHGFDVPMPRPINYFGHHIEFSQSATDQSREALHQFLQARIDGGK